MSSSCTRLYLGGLPDFVGVEEVSKHLAGYGKLVEVKIHPGYGFVEFEKEKDASDVFEVFSRHPFMGANITVEYARALRKAKTDDDPPTNKNRNGSVHAKLRYLVTVTNIPRGTCWQELKDFGRQAGGYVAFCNIKKPQNGTGFIEYTSRDDAHRAVRKLSGKTLHGSIVTLFTRENDENRKPITDRRARSRSPPRDRAIHKPYSSSSSRTFLAEAFLGQIDPYHNTRGRSLYQQRTRTSTDTSSTEPSFDQIDPYMYGVSSRDALTPPSTKNGGDYDYYDYYLRGLCEEGELHQPFVDYYTDSRWPYL